MMTDKEVLENARSTVDGIVEAMPKMLEEEIATYFSDMVRVVEAALIELKSIQARSEKKFVKVIH